MTGYTPPTLRDHARLMADYNRWMNENLYRLALSLPDEEAMAERGAFFGSLFGTLNHLCAADVIWLKRFAAGTPSPLAELESWPWPDALTTLMANGLPALWEKRQQLDALIMRWVASLDDETLARPLTYHNMKGLPFHKTLFFLVTHFFNHQTHHRGQVSTLLSQAGVDPGVTDLLVRIPDVQRTL